MPEGRLNRSSEITAHPLEKRNLFSDQHLCIFNKSNKNTVPPGCLNPTKPSGRPVRNSLGVASTPSPQTIRHRGAKLRPERSGLHSVEPVTAVSDVDRLNQNGLKRRNQTQIHPSPKPSCELEGILTKTYENPLPEQEMSHADFCMAHFEHP